MLCIRLHIGHFIIDCTKFEFNDIIVYEKQFGMETVFQSAYFILLLFITVCKLN